jgi:hypothetical protein
MREGLVPEADAKDRHAFRHQIQKLQAQPGVARVAGAGGMITPFRRGSVARFMISGSLLRSTKGFAPKDWKT